MEFFVSLPSTLLLLDIRILPLPSGALFDLLDLRFTPSLRRLHMKRLEDEEKQEEVARVCHERQVELFSYL